MSNSLSQIFMRIDRLSASTERLKQWNVMLALLELAEAALILIFSVRYILPVDVSFLTTDTFETHVFGKIVTAPAVQQLVNLNLAYVLAASLVAMATTQVINGIFRRDQYENDLRRNRSSLRWVGQSVALSLLLIAIAQLIGAYDLLELCLIFFLTLIFGFSLLSLEIHSPLNKKKPQPSTPIIVIATLALVGLWLFFLTKLAATILIGHLHLSNIVFWILGVMLVVFCLIVANVFLLYSKLRLWSNFMFGEWVYLTINFLGQTLVVWLIFADILHP